MGHTQIPSHTRLLLTLRFVVWCVVCLQDGSVDAAIPSEWRAKTNGYAAYDALADALLARREA